MCSPSALVIICEFKAVCVSSISPNAIKIHCYLTALPVCCRWFPAKPTTCLHLQYVFTCLGCRGILSPVSLPPYSPERLYIRCRSSAPLCSCPLLDTVFHIPKLADPKPSLWVEPMNCPPSSLKSDPIFFCF